MSVNCANPVIIPNNLNRYNTRKRHYIYYYCGKRVLAPIKASQFKHDFPNPTDDDLDSCYVCDTLSGETFPMFLQVPCNKCIVCKNKRVREWNARMMCETQMYDVPPLFVTLTYNDDYVPLYGIEKRDVQLFLKRLRERLEYLGYSNKIRYVFCGEYGSNTHRPHYHGLIWNMPSLPIQTLLKLIENSWAYRVTYQKYRTVSKDFKFYRFDVPRTKKQYFHRLGFAYVKIAHNNSAYYIGKYMFKPEDNTPKGMNPNFFLSSRNHGIGYDYMQLKKTYYEENPNDINIEFTNKFPDINGANAGKYTRFSFPMPTYFNTYIFPSGSKVYPPAVYRAHRECQKCLDLLTCCHMIYPIAHVQDYLKQCADKLNGSEHLRILSPLKLSSEHIAEVYSQFVDYRVWSSDSWQVQYEDNICLGRFMEYYDICLGKFQLAFDFLRNFMEYEFDFYSRLVLHDVRQMYLSEYMEKLVQLPISSRVYNLKRQEVLRKARDRY